MDENFKSRPQHRVDPSIEYDYSMDIYCVKDDFRSRIKYRGRLQKSIPVQKPLSSIYHDSEVDCNMKYYFVNLL